VTNGFAKIKNTSEFFNLNVPKLAISKNNFLLYMSRSPLPGSKKKLSINLLSKFACMAFL